MGRKQRGCLRIEARKNGRTWVLRYYATRDADGKRVEHTMAIGLVCAIGKSEAAAWAEVERLQLLQLINQPFTTGRLTFGQIAQHYLVHELPKRAHTTQCLHRHLVRDYLNPRWGDGVAHNLKPLQIEAWLDSLRDEKGLANPTRAKLRQLMSRIFTHAQKHDLIPRTDGSNPVKWVTCATTSEYEAVTLTPSQAFQLVEQFPLLEKTITVLAAATGLRISECLGLQWHDVDFENQKIHVRRTWINGQVGGPKTRTSGKPVPMGELLAGIIHQWKEASSYSRPTDWVFASAKLKGKAPRCGSVMAQKYLRPAAVRLGILSEDDQRRFGFHNLRHSLASYLVTEVKADPKTVQSLLRHSNVKTTLDLYTHAMNESKLNAQQSVMKAMLISNTVN